MYKIIIFIGPPGSGKGTQAKKIATKYNYGHISTGDLLRALQNNKNIAADEARALEEMKIGKLVPDWLVYRLTFKEIEKYLEADEGVILDGAIRNLSQAEAFQRFFTEQELANEVAVVEVALSDEDSYHRLAYRRICSACGEIIPASIKTSSCKKCGGPLVIRADDNSATIKQRIVEQGNTAIAPIREYYKKLGLLKIVDGTKTIEEVEKDIARMLV